MESERKVERKRKKRKRLIIFIAVVSIFLLGYIASNNHFTKGLFYKAFNPISEDNIIIDAEDDASAIYSVFHNKLNIFTKHSAVAYNSSGNEAESQLYSDITSLISHYNIIRIKKSEKYMAVYDEGGKNFLIYDNSKIKANLKTDYSIELVKPFDDGSFIVITDDNSSKNRVIVYDSSNKKVFMWHSGTNYITDAILIDYSQKLVLSALDLTGGEINTKMLYFDISSSTPYSERTTESLMVTNLFENSSNVVCLADDGLYYLDDEGGTKTKYSFEKKMLKRYKYIGNGRFVLSFDNNSGAGSVIETIDNGKLIGSYETEFPVDYIDYKDGNILLTETRSVEIITRGGTLIRKIDYNKELTKAFFIGSSKIILIGNSQIRIIN